MPHLFERRDWLGNSSAVWILAAMLFLTPIAGRSLSQRHVAHNLGRWLPAHDPAVGITNWAERQFPVAPHVLITWDSSSLGDPRVEALHRRLKPVRDQHGIPRGGVPHVADVVGPHELLEAMQRQSVPPREAVRRLQGTQIGSGPLRVQLTDAGRMRIRRLRLELPDAAQRALGWDITIHDPAADLATLAMIHGFSNDAGEVSDPSVPAVLTPAGDLLEDAAVDHDLTITWRGIGVGTPQLLQLVEWLANYRGANDVPETPLVDRCFFVPGTPVALSITLSGAGLADKAEAISRIRRAAQDVGIPDAELRLGGSALLVTQLDRAVSQAAWNAEFPFTKLHRRSIFLASLLVCAGLAGVMLRDLRLATIVLFAAAFATFVTLSLATALVGAVDLVLVLLPALTLMTALLGGVQVVNHWRRAHAANPRTAAIVACRSALRPCFLAALTTAIGAASLCLCPLAPVRSFGVCAVIGCLLSFLMAVYGVPALLLFWRGKIAAPQELDRALWTWWGGLLAARLRWLSPALVLAGLALGAGLISREARPPVIGAFSERSRVVLDHWALEDDLAGTARLETIVRFDAEAQDEASFFDRLELVRAIEERLRKHPQISGCFALPDFHPLSETPEEGASMVARNRHHKRARALQDDVRNGVLAGSKTCYAWLGGGSLSAADPHPVQPGDELWRIVACVNVMTADELSAVLHDVDELSREVLRFQAGAQHVLAGDMTCAARMQTMTSDGIVRASLAACAAILLLFMAELRSIGAGLATMFLNLAAIAAVFGASLLLGMTVDLGVLLAAPLAVGISAGGSLTALTGFRACYAAGQSRKEAVTNSLADCGPAIMQAGLSLAIGLLVLTSAELLPIGRFGSLLAAAIGATALVQVVLLPQCLSSSLGRWFTVAVKPAHSTASTTVTKDEASGSPLETAA